jgi:hypothetical protein
MPENIADRVLAMEAAQLEETKRFNAEREIATALAPEKFVEMKEAFRHDFASVSEGSHKWNFECDEPDAKTFHVSRILNGLAMRVFTLRLEPSVPRIVFDIQGVRPKHGSVDFLLCGKNLVFANGTSGVILPEFVMNVIMHIMR